MTLPPVAPSQVVPSPAGTKLNERSVYVRTLPEQAQATIDEGCSRCTVISSRYSRVYGFSIIIGTVSDNA
jgi:hypothetical protein